MPVPVSEVLAWHGPSSPFSGGANRAIRIKDGAGRLLAIGTMPEGMNIEAPAANVQSIAVSKVLVTEESQGGSIANSIEE
jgi:tRNA pseudouridine55 synthase